MTQFPLQNHCLGINIQLRRYMLTFIKGLIVMGNPILWLYIYITSLEMNSFAYQM